MEDVACFKNSSDRRLVLISAVNPLHFTSAETNARDTGQIKQISSVNSRGAGSTKHSEKTKCGHIRHRNFVFHKGTNAVT